jgi:probable biosynthetic protein (TIGR04099 family)
MAVVAFATRRAPVEDTVSLPLGMAQLSPTGLSEQWLLRFCGDQHWVLIAKALGQREAVFQAVDGRPVYAAFCATSLRFHAQSQPLLGKDAQILSSLFAVSDTRTGSTHQVMVAGKIIAELSMISSFVSHDATRSNTRIFRNSVLGDMHLPPAGDGLMRLDRQARETARRFRKVAAIDAPALYSERPVPALDFNAVGLLYFPTFSRIAETAAYARPARPDPVLGRDVVYLGNINQGDTVHVSGDGATSVMTRGDGSLIAAVQTLSVSV